MVGNIQVYGNSTDATGSASGAGLSGSRGSSAPNYGAAGSAFGAAVSDLFAGFGANYQISSDRAEAGMYGDAVQLALQQKEVAAENEDIKTTQANRALLTAQGTTTAEIAGAGFANSGSALDLLRSNAEQGSLANATLKIQGAIQQQTYEEQAVAYSQMERMANSAASAAEFAQVGDYVGAGVSAISGAMEL